MRPSFDSVEALTGLLTPDNRRSLAAIRDRRPRSVAEPAAALTGRAPSNLTRTLAKLHLWRIDDNTRRPHTSPAGLPPFTFTDRSAMDHTTATDAGHDRGPQGGRVRDRGSSLT